jgi:YD repeat-containing protein
MHLYLRTRQSLIIISALIFLRSQAISQQLIPEKSPDVTAFMQMNYLPLNLYTGNAEVKVPLYSINFDGLEIPIELSYNTLGVNIDASASRVGLNWSLSAGGMITRETLGQQDLQAAGFYNSERAEIIFKTWGYLRDLFPVDYSYAGGGPVAYVTPTPYRDTEPDLMQVAAPGARTAFVHKQDGSIFELEKTGYKFKGPFQGSIGDIKEWTKRFGYDVINTQGFVYGFYERETNVVFTKRGGTGEDVGLSDNLNTTPLPPSTTEATIVEMLRGNNLSTMWGNGGYEEVYPIIHLNSITNPRTGRSVKYVYSKNYIVDNDRHIERKFWVNNQDHSGIYLSKQINYEHDFSIEKVLDRIEFPDGVINFYYDAGRLDVPGGKILRKIEIRNATGKFIKGILFEHSYFQTTGCTGNQCYRLKLTGVKFFDKDNNVLPGYSFSYNSTMLPKRFSLNRDYTGMYNGNHGLTEKTYVPKLYYKASQGRASYLPFPSTGYTQLPGTNASLLSNLTYAKAGILEEIVYPTGGYTRLSYDLNSFVFNGSTVAGGGLRVISQSMYDNDNALERTITYNYNIPNTSTTSGKISNVPRFLSCERSSSTFGTYYINQYQSSRPDLTQGALVGYSTCKIAETGNGYTITTYANPADIPNNYPSTYGVYGAGVPTASTDKYFNDGFVPDIFQSMEIKRGREMSSATYDNNGQLVKSTTNLYTYFNYGVLPIDQNVVLYENPSIYQNGSNDSHMRCSSSLVSESYLVTTELSEDKFSGTTLSKSITNTFDPTAPFLKEKSFTSSKNEMYKHKFYYPFNAEVSGFPNMDKLSTLNVMSPVRKINLLNDVQVADTLTSYADWGNNRIFPNSILGSRSTSPAQDPVVAYESYDKKGNLTQLTNRSGLPVTTIWGYEYDHKIAEILGATNASVLSALQAQNFDYLQTMTDAEIAVEMNKIRTNLPAAHVYSFARTPLQGVTEITDPNGRTISFSYDSFGRLILQKDADGNVISSNAYNFKLVASATFTPVTLSLDISKTRVPEYLSIPITNNEPVQTLFSSDAKGGRGDYSYEWTQAGSGTLLGKRHYYRATIPCGTSFNAQLKITDLNGTSVTKTLTSNARNCSEPFYLTNIIQQFSPKQYYINAEGGSYRFSYRWVRTAPNTTPAVSSTLYDDNICPLPLNNSTSNPITYTLQVTVTDVETGQVIQRSSQFVIQPEFQPPSCFVAGTKIMMADGHEKNIENVAVGDSVFTFNIERNALEKGRVESIVSPMHDRMIEIEFACTDVKNRNTVDHPYYVQGKGWASFDPELTNRNYGLQVRQLERGDFVLSFSGLNLPLEQFRIIQISPVNETVKTYNLEKVSTNHNYFANKILVHNKSSAEK